MIERLRDQASAYRIEASGDSMTATAAIEIVSNGEDMETDRRRPLQDGRRTPLPNCTKDCEAKGGDTVSFDKVYGEDANQEGAEDDPS
jgi:hypothetical protein